MRRRSESRGPQGWWRQKPLTTYLCPGALLGPASPVGSRRASRSTSTLTVRAIGSGPPPAPWPPGARPAAGASAAWELFGDGPDAADVYARTARTFADHYPKWELWFEQMLVNHVLFEAFPYSDRRQDVNAAYAALCATYALVRFLAIGCTAQRHDTTQLVDVCAAAFRLIAHTAFNWNAPIALGPDTAMDALWVLVQN